MSTHQRPDGTPHATWLRRIAALFVDSAAYQWVPLVVFWLESAVGVAVAGGSFGQLLVRIRVHRTDGRPLSLLRALQRQLLVCLVIPPLVFRDDGRGLHDLWTRSATYELRAAPAA